MNKPVFVDESEAYRIVVTEHFMLNGEPYKADDVPINETKFDIRTPYRQYARAMTLELLDFIREHNMKSENEFDIKLYDPTGRRIYLATVKGKLSSGEYAEQLHCDMSEELPSVRICGSAPRQKRRHAYKDGKEFTIKQMRKIADYFSRHTIQDTADRFGISSQHARNIVNGDELPYATDYVEGDTL